MFMKLSRLALIAALGAGSMVLGNSYADAARNGSHMGQFNGNGQFDGNFQRGNRNMTWQRDRDGGRCMTRMGNCRHYHGGYYYENPWWTLPLVVGSVAVGSAIASNSHAEWCSAHYRSYNSRTNMWLGNSGRYYQCVSGY